MAWHSFFTDFFGSRPSPSAPSVERRDFDLKSAEAQRLFVFGRQDGGVVVSDDTILSSTPFYSAMRYVSEGVAMLGRKVKVREGGRYYDDPEHPISYLFRRRPYPTCTWNDLLATWVCNAMLGNGFLRIHWDPITARPRAIQPIPSRFVSIEYDRDGFQWYRISGEVHGKQCHCLLPHTDILHLKGLSLDALTGVRTSITHRVVHAASLGSDLYTERVFENGAFPSIAVTVDETLDAAEAKILEDNLISRMGGARNGGRPLILDQGKKVEKLQWSPVDVALEAAKHLSAEQVSQITKVPRDLLGLDTSGTYGAAVQRSKDFYVHVLQPWAEKMQDEIASKLFFDTEVALGTHRFEFDPSLYLSMPPEEQTKMYSVAISSMQMTPNEVRAERGLDPMEGGDSLFGDINLLPIENLVQVALAKHLSSVGEAKINAQPNYSPDDEQQPQGN